MHELEIMIFLVVVAVLFAPLVLSIIALVMASKNRRALREYRTRPIQPAKARTEPAQPPSAPTPSVKEAPAPRQPAAKPPPPPSSKPEKKSGGTFEAAVGGRLASFIGVAVLLIGIAFLVGYAIKHAWLGPGARVVLGLISGGLLVFLGHMAEVRGQNRLKVLARALTGGGSALFYFCVFAAYGIYELIPALLCGAGLALSALAVLALALVYSSQAVAIIGVTGAFITPLLIGGDYEHGIFPLVYIALLNLPVMLLGLRRRWQILYNLAFALTVLFSAVWIDWFRQDNWIAGIVFTTIYFLEFAALGLLKLRGERKFAGRTADIIRLCANSGLYMAAFYWLFEQSDYAAWTAAAFLVAAAIHIAIARTGWRWLPQFKSDILAFLIGGLTFASLALPIQLDGAWVSCGWAIEGVILCWFALRARSLPLRVGAIFLGLIGLLKTLLIDIDLYAVEPNLFLNARFGSGMLSALLLATQGWLTARTKPEDQGKTNSQCESLLVWGAFAGVLAVFFADTFWTLGGDDPWAWTLTSLAVLLVAIAAALLAATSQRFRGPALALLLIFPVKILIDVVAISGLLWWDAGRPFLNSVFIVEATAIIAAIAWLTMPRAKGLFAPAPHGDALAAATTLLSIAAGIALVTSELFRIDSDWSSSAVTIWWALAAICLVLFGLFRNLRRFRYCGLALFALVLFKIFFFDLAGLRDLERIAAFIGAGILLLLLSFAYQRMSSMFTDTEKRDENP